VWCVCLYVCGVCVFVACVWCVCGVCMFVCDYFENVCVSDPISGRYVFFQIIS